MQYILIENLLTSKQYIYKNEYVDKSHQACFEECFEYLKNSHNKNLFLKLDENSSLGLVYTTEKVLRKGVLWNSSVQKSYNIFKLSLVPVLKNVVTENSYTKNVSTETDSENFFDLMSPGFKKIVKEFKELQNNPGYAQYLFL